MELKTLDLHISERFNILRGRLSNGLGVIYGGSLKKPSMATRIYRALTYTH